MIQNLNRLSFQPFGMILPNMPNVKTWEQPWHTVELSDRSAPAWRAADELWLNCDEGMAVLTLSCDGVIYHDFYLDKMVKINAGVYFSVTAFREYASVSFASPKIPQELEDLPSKKELHLSRQLKVEKLYTLFYQEKEPGFLFSGESHPVVELTYVDQGSLHSVADGQDILLEQGDVMLYGPNQWHMQYADIHVAPRFMTVAFDVGDYDLSGLYNRKFKSPQKAIDLLQKMLREQERMDRYSADMILSLMSMVLLSLLRRMNEPEDTLKSAHCLSNENEIIRRAQQYITTNVRNRLSVPLVAQNTDVSTSYLTALFHKHLQISPGEYIRRIKLQESKQMIREGTMNFTEIAQILQYSTIHHFSRQFKEKFGITPSQYAKSIK
ncbi:MAG: helix-turn-helix transcriptional regulator [Oscillospiraceae bacterium]|nr:helix-turn-helix transcriptional regulator [Oscillospiraceae bacterium]